MREVLPHALFALAPPLEEEALQEAHDPVRPHDTRPKPLPPPHGVLCHAADTIVATFEVRRSREVMVDEEADLPHAVRQRAKFSPSLVLLPACIGEHVYLRRPAVVSGGGSGFAPVTAQVLLVARDPGKAVEVKIAIAIVL